MKKIYFLFLSVLAFGFFLKAQTPHLVISQVYGAGGNSGAVYNRDFVELFNPTAFPVSLSGYSIQYASASGTSWQKLDLYGTIAANSYFLVQMTITGTNGAALPPPDQVAGTAIEMAASNGKLALINSTTVITGTGCPPGSTVTDLVGYGTANCFESAAAPAASAANAIFRASNGCIDTDNNSTDFSAAPPSPRNSSSPANNCPPGGPLPVRFTSFRATERSNGVQLQWTNETEENLSAYYIQRSADSRSFITISEAKPLKNDNSRVSYTVFDDNPLYGHNYYRIKAVEEGGKEVYSYIVRINTSLSGSGLIVYPNPVRGNEVSLQIINLPKGAYSFKLYNNNGQLVVSANINHAGGSITETIPLNNLQRGWYSVQITGNKEMYQKFLIQ